MKKNLLLSFSLLIALFSKAQTVPNGDMESINACFAGGFVFSYWTDYGCTEPLQNPTGITHSGAGAMLISSDINGVITPVVSQDFYVGSIMPSCVNFWGKIDLNPADSVKVKVYFNCNGSWFNCGNWNYTNVNSTSLPYTQYNIPLNVGIMCLTGMDSMRIELIGGKNMAGSIHTDFYVDDVTFNCTTGIEQAEKKNELSVFPNPANDKIYFSYSEKINSVKIYSLTGQLITTVQNSAVSYADVSELQAGVYFLECRTENGIVRKRIEIAR
ncbi:MAG: T9SS type A sorting domain-containing protein [Bacteroidia bacterium]|nr:T9SS type A sorting domain-containing protein [Bacteroidia bacterium]